jgi:hypothetical protein
MGRGQRQFELEWCWGGYFAGNAYDDQPHGTTHDMRNVRGYDPQTGRKRGSQRAGLSKAVTAQHSSAPFQDLIVRKAIDSTASPTAQIPRSRTIELVGVVNGNVKTAASGAASWTVPTNGAGALSSSPSLTYSATHFGSVYFCDGASYKVYDGTSVATWTPTDGSLPTSGAERARLCEVYRGRMVLSGLKGDDHNWFMSAVNDPLNYDYSPTSPTPTQAVAGNNANAGKCPDVVNCLIPFFDDLLFFGCDSSIWMLSTDPMFGGYIDNVSDTIGMAYGRPWCALPDKSILFFSSRGGMYRMVPSGEASGIERMTSHSLDEELADVDISTSVVRMAWDDRTQGAHLFITPLSGSAASDAHYYWDARNDAFYKDDFTNYETEPTTVAIYDGDDPDDRHILLGCRDGYCRKIDYDADDDDGNAIDSYVWLGPMYLRDREVLRLKEVQPVLGKDSKARSTTRKAISE